MPSPFAVKIKVPPYLKKYIVCQSENKSEPLIFHHKHIYSISISQKLSNFNALKYFDINEKENIKEHLHASTPDHNYVTILLPYSREKDPRRFNYLSVNDKRKFRQEVRDDFYFEMIRYVIKQMRYNKQRKEAIYEFYDKYNITEDDLKFESIYRHTSRILQPFLS